MEGELNHFKGVSLLVTHYNRSASLERLLKAFADLRCSFEEIVVSDDGSREEHLSRLKEIQALYPFRLISSARNMGLGHNMNKGQAAVRTPLTLYVQEDFVPTTLFPEKLSIALNFMQQERDLDMVRFYSYIPYPSTRPYKEGFSELVYKPWGTDYRKIYYYSDHPHLRRSNFLERFGRYAEGIKGDRTEYRMCLSVIQNRGRALFYDDFQSLFVQMNSEEEPSTMSRRNWTTSKGKLISFIRSVYRQIRYNYDILFNKVKR